MKEMNWFQTVAEFFFGVEYRYFVNHGTKEIHDLEKSDSKCRLKMITKGAYITEKKARRLLKKGYNGCRYCWPKQDKG